MYKESSFIIIYKCLIFFILNSKCVKKSKIVLGPGCKFLDLESFFFNFERIKLFNRFKISNFQVYFQNKFCIEIHKI